MADEALLFASAAELGRLIRTRKVSSVELTRAYLERLETRGTALNAVAEIPRAVALRQAAQMDRESAQGRFRSPLHGVPYGAKDLFATRGIPTRWGSPAHRDQVFPFDATVIERLRAAGAVLVAKLAMVELAGGGGYEFPAASLQGPGRNPWDANRWAGGSSSGSGAATGAGCVGFAVGTETWGSIMVPAAFCNVTGLRPTYGRVSRYGAMALSWAMDKVGPMARSAEDCGLILEAMAGRDPRDPSSAHGPFRCVRERTMDRPLRLGLLPVEYDKYRARAAHSRFDSALGVFRKLGCPVAEVKLPSFPYDLAASTIISVEGSSSFENLIHSERLDLLADKAQQGGLIAGLAVSGAHYLRAMRVRTLAGPAAVKVFERCDALVAPTLLHGAPPLEKSLDESFQEMGGNGGPTNLLGWPSLTVPMGPDERGLPLGLEIIGRPYAENTLLALGMAFQRETDWHRRKPGVNDAG